MAMKSKQTMFFAAFEDFEEILRDFEASIDICYYKAGLLDTELIPVYDSLFEAPHVGIAVSGDWNRLDTYLILRKSIPLEVRVIPQKSGGTKFAVDQMRNATSIELKLGGILEGRKGVIVAGRVATISDDKYSLEMYGLLSRNLKKVFKRIGAFYVGRIAEEKLKEGWRLVTNEKLPKEHDLSFTEGY